ncbi:biotin-dependent carboxyltransferase family protein [Chloroflexota bacterium]
MDTFEVLQPGILTTVQDLGRHGYQQFGVPVSGALDSYAFRVANILIGNDEGLAGLEITLTGLRLRCLRDTVIAVTGADLSPRLNHTVLPMWQAVSVRCGDTISFVRPKSGCRSYLAVANGINVPKVMGSRSTYLKGYIGGLEGRPLRSGDRLQSAAAESKAPKEKMPPEYIPNYKSKIELRVILGPQDDYFTERGIFDFLHSEYTISTEADRVGYRLQGTRIGHRAGADIISDGIPLGAVQIPGDGLPIILLADRQTTGGYAKIVTVISVDIPKLAQSKPGDQIAFRSVTEGEAHHALKEYEQRIDVLRSHLQS